MLLRCSTLCLKTTRCGPRLWLYVHACANQQRPLIPMLYNAPVQEDGAAVDLDSQRQGKCVVLKTSTRQTIFLPVVGLVDAEALKPGDLVGVNKDSYLILDTLPAEYDSRVKAMEVDEKPTEDYSDVGGLDKQIQELVEAIVLPVTHKDKFKALGIKPPKVCQVTTVAVSLLY